MALLTPVKVSVPTDASPVAVPACRLMVTAGGGAGVDDPRVAVAGDGVVAAEALELVEGAVVADVEGACGAEAGGVVGVVEVGALDAFDRAQRVGADRGVAGHGAGRHVDGDRGRSRSRCCCRSRCRSRRGRR